VNADIQTSLLTRPAPLGVCQCLGDLVSGARAQQKVYIRMI
jgi:hypothetical protein